MVDSIASNNTWAGWGYADNSIGGWTIPTVTDTTGGWSLYPGAVTSKVYPIFEEFNKEGICLIVSNPEKGSLAKITRSNISDDVLLLPNRYQGPMIIHGSIFIRAYAPGYSGRVALLTDKYCAVVGSSMYENRSVPYFRLYKVVEGLWERASWSVAPTLRSVVVLGELT